MLPERYSISSGSSQLEKEFSIEPHKGYQPRYNAAPTQLLPVITSAGREGLSFFFWGTIPGWSNNRAISKKLLTASGEELLVKNSYKQAVSSRRCVVPMDGFYGWKKVGKKTKVPFRVALNDNLLSCFAAIWDEFDDEKDERRHVFRIVTVNANSIVSELDETMPLVLNKEMREQWLDPKTTLEDLSKILDTPYPEEGMFKYTITSKIEDINYDLPDLLNQVRPMDQHGNYSLFD